MNRKNSLWIVRFSSDAPRVKATRKYSSGTSRKDTWRKWIASVSPQKYVKSMSGGLILDDASEFCDRYIIIKNGMIVGNINDEVQKSGRKRILVKIENLPQTKETLSNTDFEQIESISKNTFLLTGVEELDLKKVINDFAQKDIDITSIEFYEKGIEEIFLEMVSGT